MSAKRQNYEDKFKLCPSISNFLYKESFRTSSTYSWIICVILNVQMMLSILLPILIPFCGQFVIPSNLGTLHDFKHLTKPETKKLNLLTWSCHVVSEFSQDGCWIWHLCEKLSFLFLRWHITWQTTNLGLTQMIFMNPITLLFCGLYQDL